MKSYFSLDIHTVLFLLALGNLATAFFLAVYRSETVSRRAYYEFLAGKLLQSAAWLLLGLRDQIPIYYSAHVGNILLAAGWLMEALAYISVNRPRPRWETAAAVSLAIFVLIFALFARTPNQYVYLISAFAAAIFLTLAVLLLDEAQRSVLRYSVSILYFAFSSILIVRTASSFIDPEFRLLSSNLVQTLTFLATFCLVVLSGTNFLLLLREQTDQQLRDANHTLEERVRQRTAEVQDLYDNAPNGYLSVDTRGIVQMINQTGLGLVGYAREEVVGKSSISDFLTPESQQKLQTLLAGFLEQGSIADFEIDVLRKDGSLLPVIGGATIVRDAQGTYLGSRIMVFDNSERKKARQALSEAHQRLEEMAHHLQTTNLALEKALRARDEFMSAVSHELRTPLAGILGIAEVLQLPYYGDLNAKQQKAVAMIESSGKRLLELVTEVLDYTQIQSGKAELKLRACSLTAVCGASLRAVRESAAAKNQQIDFDPTSEDIIVEADERRLVQIIVNLLENAVKFTPEQGRIGLAVLRDPQTGQVQIHVSDTGIGIQDEDLPRLFQPFVQLDASLARQYQGTGLGLALVRSLVELHGGSVSVASVFGQGSTFTVTLPG